MSWPQAVSASSQSPSHSDSSRPPSSSDFSPTSSHKSGESSFSWPHVLPAAEGAKLQDLNHEAQSRLALADKGKRPMSYDADEAHGKRIQASLASTGHPNAAPTAPSAQSQSLPAGTQGHGPGITSANVATGATSNTGLAASSRERDEKGRFQFGNKPWNKGPSRQERQSKLKPAPKPGSIESTKSPPRLRLEPGRDEKGRFANGYVPWNKGLKGRLGPDGLPLPKRKPWNAGILMSQRVDAEGKPIPYKKPGPKPGSRRRTSKVAKSASSSSAGQPGPPQPQV